MFKKFLASIPYTLIAIIIIASFLRLYNLIPLDNLMLPPGLYPDEAMNGNNAQEAIDIKNFKFFYPENFGREGLFINIQGAFIAAFGHEPWALRLPNAIFGILTVLGLYFLTKELFKDKRLALLAAFLLAINFWHINFSRIGFRAIMAPAFLVWAIYLLLKSFNQTKNNYQLPITNYQNNWKLVIRNWALPALAGLIYGLGFHSYIAYRATPLLILMIFAMIYRQNNELSKKQFWTVFSIFSIAALMAFLPLGIYFLNNPTDFLGRTAGISIFSSQAPLKDLGLNILKTAGMFNIFGDFNWRHNVAGKPELFWPVGIMFLIGIIKILKLPRLEIGNWKLGIPLIWLTVVLLPVVISNEGLPHALRSILAVPPVFIIAAIGGIKIFEYLKTKLNPRLLLISCLILLSLLIFESYVTYFITWGGNPNVKNAFAYNDYIIAGELNKLPKELPKYIIVSDAQGTIRRDTPISLQSILFLTDTFTDENRAEKNFHYLTTEQAESEKIPSGSFVISL